MFPAASTIAVVPLKFRFMVAMSGSLGLGGNLNKYSPEDMQAAARFVAFYKRIRPTVQRGALYRLIAPEGSEFSATEYVSTDGQPGGALWLIFIRNNSAPRSPPSFCVASPRMHVYKVEAIDPGQVQEVGTVSGAYLMHHGLNLNLRGDYDSTSVILEKQ